MKNYNQSPAELRAMFGSNLRKLSAGYPSISELSRQLGINRTQFNRYLAGESFPRPDVLARICSFLDVDARVLLEPVEQISTSQDPFAMPFLRDYVGAGITDISQDQFPSGFFRFSRRSFVNNALYVVGLVWIFREGASTYLRGYEARDAMRMQDLPTDAPSREFRGMVMMQEDGISIIASRHNAMTSSFNYLNRVASFENNYWVGYVTRTVPETAGGLRATRLVYEYLGATPQLAIPSARTAGFTDEAGLPAFHRRLLQPDKAFF